MHADWYKTTWCLHSLSHLYIDKPPKTSMRFYIDTILFTPQNIRNMQKSTTAATECFTQTGLESKYITPKHP